MSMKSRREIHIILEWTLNDTIVLVETDLMTLIPIGIPSDLKITNGMTHLFHDLQVCNFYFLFSTVSVGVKHINDITFSEFLTNFLYLML